MTFKIYTKTGDKGQTSLIGGVRVPKHHIRIEAYGTVDELNSHIGLIAASLIDKETEEVLAEIQDRLFTIGSNLALAPDKAKMEVPDLKPEDVELLEKEIDKMDAELPELKSFVLPGGSPLVANTHIARCVCRRAERIVTHLAEESHVEDIVIIYLNRLSDYLFNLSRKIAKDTGAPEVPWRPRK